MALKNYIFFNFLSVVGCYESSRVPGCPCAYSDLGYVDRDVYSFPEDRVVFIVELYLECQVDLIGRTVGDVALASPHQFEGDGVFFYGEGMGGCCVYVLVC